MLQNNKEIIKITQDIKDVIDNLFNNKITPANILPIITNLMSIIDKTLNIPGNEKKQICMDIIYEIILTDDNTSVIVDKGYTITMLNNIFDTFINNIIDVSKGEFNINKGIKFFKYLLSLFKKIDFQKIIKCIISIFKK